MIRIHFPGLAAPATVDIAKAITCPTDPESDFWGRRYNQLNAEARQYFQAAPAAEAQVFVYPYRYEPNEQTRQAATEAQMRGVPCLFFTHGDDPMPVIVPAGTLYRHSIFADQRRANEFAMPAFADDPLRDGCSIQPREKGPRPRLGFCGYVATPLLRLVYRLAKRQQKALGLEMRARLLARLGKNRRVETHFLPQKSFSGGAKGIMGHDLAHAQILRQRFLENLLGNDYTLCVRGAGNFSYRFYECLAAGRIPLFINTRCVMPFEDRIDWRRHCVWVEESDLDRAGDILADFHQSVSAADFLEMQRANRRLWEQYLTPLGFYRQLFDGMLGQPEKFKLASPP